KDVPAQDHIFFIHQQFAQSFGRVIRDGTFNLAKFHTGNPVLYPLLTQLLFRPTDMCQSGISESYPGNDAIIKRPWLAPLFDSMSILCRQLPLLIRDMRKLQAPAYS